MLSDLQVFVSLATSAALPALSATIYQDGADWRSDAPLMDGYVQYSLFETNFDSNDRWVPMNTTGLNMTGNEYDPFDDLPSGQSGWRLNGDESSEIIFALGANYSDSVTSTLKVGKKTGESGLYTHVVSTCLDASSTSNSRSIQPRDLYSSGPLSPLPFTSQTVQIGKENAYSEGGCSKSWNFTATTVDAEGIILHFSSYNSLSVNVPTKQPATVTLTNAYDPTFSATVTYNGVLPFLYARGASPRIGNISLEQVFSIGFCLDDD